MRSLLITAEAVTRAALMREESRGAHTRVDFPGESDEWVKYNVVVKKGADGTMEVAEATEAREPPADLVDDRAMPRSKTSRPARRRRTKKGA